MSSPRLTRLEWDLGPQRVIVVWIHELQSYSSLDAWRDAWEERHPDVSHLAALADRCETRIRRQLRKRPMSDQTAAVAVGRRDLLFRYQLVFSCNEAAHEQTELLGLRVRLAVAQLPALMSLTYPDRTEGARLHPSELDSLWRSWLGAVDALVDAVRVEAAARAVLERRYLGGAPALATDIAAAWAELEDAAHELVTLMVSVPMRRRGRRRRYGPRTPIIAERPEARVARRAAEIADLARIAAWASLGRTDWVAHIAQRQRQRQREACQDRCT